MMTPEPINPSVKGIDEQPIEQSNYECYTFLDKNVPVYFDEDTEQFVTIHQDLLDNPYYNCISHVLFDILNGRYVFMFPTKLPTSVTTIVSLTMSDQESDFVKCKEFCRLLNLPKPSIDQLKKVFEIEDTEI